MADARRIDERIEFSLTSRSAVALVTGGGLVLVLVFALGVMLGRQLARPPTAVRPLAQATAPEKADGKKDDEAVAFTFHERLVYEPESPLRKAAKPRDPPPPPPTQPAVARTKPEVVVVRGDGYEPAVERAVEPAAEPVAERKSPGVSARNAAPEDDSPVPAAQPEISQPDVSPDVVAAAPAPKAVAAPPTPTSPATTTPVPPPPSAAGGEARWSVQFGAAPNREDANRLLEQLRSKGVPAYIVEVDLPDKGRFFRVRAGRFADKSAADELLDEARAAGFDGLVMR